MKNLYLISLYYISIFVIQDHVSYYFTAVLVLLPLAVLIGVWLLAKALKRIAEDIEEEFKTHKK